MEENVTIKPHHPLWWLYFAYCIFAWVTGFWALAHFSGPALVFNVSAILDLIGIFGLCFFIRSRPFLLRRVWVVLAVVYLFRLVIFVALTLNTVLPWRSFSEHRLSLLNLLGMLATLPLIYALYKYSRPSQSLWSRVRAEAA